MHDSLASWPIDMTTNVTWAGDWGILQPNPKFLIACFPFNYISTLDPTLDNNAGWKYMARANVTARKFVCPGNGNWRRTLQRFIIRIVSTQCCLMIGHIDLKYEL